MEQLDVLNMDLARIREDRIKGAQIRARSIKLNEGEKPSAYFLSLEKANYINKTMLEIFNTKENLITNRQEILKTQKDFYQKLYKKGQTTDLERSDLHWVTQYVRKISNEKKLKLEQNINIEELEKVLFKTKNNKAPGPDGYSYEFFKIFWDDIKFLMLHAFQRYLDTETLTEQQKTGIITCLPKQGNDRRHMKNWRPITLLNSTYKIFSGILADRLKTTLDNIIHNDQKGFVQNRFIGENIRLIHDIMTECEIQNLQGILILVDFEKAFDTLDWKFIESVFKLSNFGENFLSWIKILQYGSKSQIIQNGYLSDPILLGRGCRQGDPVSPYIFVICAEILGIAIRENRRIEGITIYGHEHKISQYADDTTLVIKKDKANLNRVLDTLKFFHSTSGLKVNIEKTKVVQLGVRGDGRMINLEKEKLELTEEFVLLGVTFNVNELDKITDKNCTLKFPKMKKTLRQWKRRHLTINGKISVFKSLISSMITHILLSLPSPSQEFIYEYENILKDFLWGGKPPKYRREILEYPNNLGGLQLHNLQRFSMSLKMTWLRRLLLSDSGWTTFALTHEIDKCWLYGDKYLEKKKNTIKNAFWKEVVTSMYDLRKIMKPITDYDYLSWPLWDDNLVRLPDINKLKVCGVNVVADLLNSSWEVLTKATIEQTRNVNLNFLEYMAIKQCITRFIKNAKKDRVNIGPYRPYMLNLAFSQKKGCQDIYYKTGQYGEKLLDEISVKWDILDVDSKDIKMSMALFKQTTRNMYLMDIQFKLWHNRVATRFILYRMNITENENCIYCDQLETNAHAFVLCERAQMFWRDVKLYLQRLGYRNFRLEHSVIILGNKDMDGLFNLILVLGKKIIYQNRGTVNLYSMRHLERVIEIERESEEINALNHDKMEVYETKWEKYLTA